MKNKATTPRACACCAGAFTRDARVYRVPAAEGMGRVGVPYGTFCEECWSRKIGRSEEDRQIEEGLNYGVRPL